MVVCFGHTPPAHTRRVSTPAVCRALVGGHGHGHGHGHLQSDVVPGSRLQGWERKEAIKKLNKKVWRFRRRKKEKKKTPVWDHSSRILTNDVTPRTPCGMLFAVSLLSGGDRRHPNPCLLNPMACPIPGTHSTTHAGHHQGGAQRREYRHVHRARRGADPAGGAQPAGDKGAPGDVAVRQRMT